MQSTEIVTVKSNFQVVIADKKDDIIIDTAYDGEADMIVTGDKHLLEIEAFKGIKVTTIEILLKQLPKEL